MGESIRVMLPGNAPSIATQAMHVRTYGRTKKASRLPLLAAFKEVGVLFRCRRHSLYAKVSSQ